MRLFTGEGAALSCHTPSSTWRRGSGVGVPFPRTSLPRGPGQSHSPGLPLLPLSPLHGVVGARVRGAGGEADLAGTSGPPVPSEQGDSPPWSLLLCQDLCPCPTPLTPFQDWILFRVEMSTPSWALENCGHPTAPSPSRSAEPPAVHPAGWAEQSRAFLSPQHPSSSNTPRDTDPETRHRSAWRCEAVRPEGGWPCPSWWSPKKPGSAPGTPLRLRCVHSFTSRQGILQQNGAGSYFFFG